MTSLIIRSPHRSPAEAPQTAGARPLSSPWRWMVVACLLLGISGGIRFWRERQFAILAAKNVSPPFRLDELPRILGDWRSEERNDGQLEADVARIAGSSDHIVRTYVDEKSGDRVTVLALYGLAERVFGHKPDVCYPAAGYELVDKTEDRELTVPGMKSPVRYRWAIYMKRIGGIRTYQEAYHTFLYNGEWTPDASDQWKLFRYQPAMFKIQLGRPISSLSKAVHGPSEALLGELVQQIRSRMAPKTAVEAAETPPASKSPAPPSAAIQGTRPG